jgi:hypothetical protein
MNARRKEIATIYDTLNARVDLPPTPVAVPAARRMVVALLTGWESRPTPRGRRATSQ